MTGPRIDHYDWAGGREAMLRFGPDTGPLVIAALPLFEEANRTRAFVVAICRMLAARGIGSRVPDFPGTGESLTDVADTTVCAMRAAYVALVESAFADHRPYAVGIRSGALLDTAARLRGRWHLSPQTGDEVRRDLYRLAGLSDTPGGHAGNRVSDAMLDGLSGLLPIDPSAESTVRTVRLETDPRPADLKISGAPLWRRAEPGNDMLLAEHLAGDIAQWIAACER